MPEWITGRNPVYEVLRAGRRKIIGLQTAKGVRKQGRIIEILNLAEKQNIPVSQVPRNAIGRINSGHQGVALSVGEYPYSSLVEMLELAEERRQPPFLLILDTLQDPQNLGALLRTAEAVGVHGALLPLRQTATITPAVVNASSGASEHLLIEQTNLAQAIAALKENNVWVVGLDGSDDAKLPEEVRLDGALALVVGGEGGGMRRLVRDSCDMLLRLPMRGQIESLNAAVAGSVALYWAWQARAWLGLRI